MAKKKTTTQKAKGLITLGDYRRVAKQSLFSYGYRKSKSKSMYDAVRVALNNISTLLVEAYLNKPETEQWGVIGLSGTEYEMNNEPLLRCVQLMELAIFYSDQKKRDKVFQNWHKRPDKDISVFTSVGFSYLEAAFDFAEERGGDIIYSLQNAYIIHLNSKGVRGVFTGPMEFLSNTPKIDKLRIWQEPDPIIKEWYNRILAGLRKGFPYREYTPSRRKVEFKNIYKQLKHEWTLAEKPEDPFANHDQYLTFSDICSVLKIDKDDKRYSRLTTALSRARNKKDFCIEVVGEGHTKYRYNRKHPDFNVIVNKVLR